MAARPHFCRFPSSVGEKRDEWWERSGGQRFSLDLGRGKKSTRKKISNPIPQGSRHCDGTGCPVTIQARIPTLTTCSILALKVFTFPSSGQMLPSVTSIYNRFYSTPEGLSSCLRFLNFIFHTFISTLTSASMDFRFICIAQGKMFIFDQIYMQPYVLSNITPNWERISWIRSNHVSTYRQILWSTV